MLEKNHGTQKKQSLEVQRMGQEEESQMKIIADRLRYGCACGDI